jgi:hypothetical protein
MSWLDPNFRYVRSDRDSLSEFRKRMAVRRLEVLLRAKAATTRQAQLTELGRVLTGTMEGSNGNSL